jgi:hypothetical protein
MFQAHGGIWNVTGDGLECQAIMVLLPRSGNPRKKMFVKNDIIRDENSTGTRGEYQETLLIRGKTDEDAAYALFCLFAIGPPSHSPAFYYGRTTEHAEPRDRWLDTKV